MARPFTGFTEAAILYAKNAKIVDEMFQSFYEEMRHFCEALTERLRESVPEELFKTTTSNDVEEAEGCPRHWYAWLSDDDSPLKQHAYLWIDLWDELLVASNHLWLKSSAPSLSTEQLSRLWSIPAEERFKTFCILKGQKRWSIFKLQFDLPKDDPIGYAAEPIASVLKAMYTAETGKALP